MPAATRVRTKDPEARRDQLLAAAERLFAKKGAVETTVADIADAAGLAKGTFYVYFPSREHCVVALKERLAHGLVERFMEALESVLVRLGPGAGPSDVEAVATRLLDESFEYAAEHADTFANLFHRGNTIEIDQHSLAAERAIIDCVTDIIVRLNEQGLTEVTHPHETAKILFNGVHWALDEALCRERTRDLRKLREAAVEVCVRSLGAKPLSAS